MAAFSNASSRHRLTTANVRFRPIADISSARHSAGVTGIVWISRALVHPTNQRPFRNDVAERDHDRLIEIKQANERGEVLSPNQFPTVIFGAPHALERDYQVPDLFAAYGYWMVSEPTAVVLRQFDLGQAQLKSVPVLKSDRQTSIGGNWFCINFGNAKRVVLPEQSEKIRLGPQGRYNVPLTLADDQVVVSAEALQLPDIWVDPQLWCNFFISHGLREALRKAKLSSRFYLTRCRVAD